MKSSAGSPNRVRNLFFFSAKKCLGDQKIRTKRQNYEHREGNSPPPFSYGKGRGKGIFCSPRVPRRRLVRFPRNWNLFLVTIVILLYIRDLCVKI